MSHRACLGEKCWNSNFEGLVFIVLKRPLAHTLILMTASKYDSIDLLQGHYIVSVSRDMAPTTPKGGIEAIASFPLALVLITGSFLQ